MRSGAFVALSGLYRKFSIGLLARAWRGRYTHLGHGILALVGVHLGLKAYSVFATAIVSAILNGARSTFCRHHIGIVATPIFLSGGVWYYHLFLRDADHCCAW
jgi:hypothetical protein